MRKIKFLPAVVLTVGLFFNLISGYRTVNAQFLQETDKKLTVIIGDNRYDFYYPEIDFDGEKYYLKNIEEIVSGIAYENGVNGKDACVKIYPENEQPFVYEKEKAGYKIDEEKLTKKIDYALNNGIEKITVEKQKVEPAITVEKLKQATVKRGEFSTDYSSSSAERKSNVNLAISYLNGTIIKKGEEFSFNKTVGKRSEERGFLPSKVIINGQFQEGVGGGVCQVSSTLYNALILSNVEITERHQHSLQVSYVEPSFDAMVSDGYADLKFVNLTENDLYIVASANGRKIRIRIYGEENDYEIKRISKTEEVLPPPKREIRYTDELEKGKAKVLSYEKNGLISSAYIEIYKNGKFVKSKRLSKDKYLPVNEVVLIGK